ncbi:MULTISPECIES: GNAT family N-acetyltransferase [Bacillus cereus group]|uniref:GNAT family N-acetyltransferase n=1 Tax=Bacillus cereus group TaxID=86661 RepID=UPI000BF330ED|nr:MULTISPECIES: GNAT family N-acetyltransferase [Bacillus cereus group]PFA16677.1 GNAT family N-acetyltransferase [Bacillus cereus]PGZ12287.1 GNAT family N-acetyltransferase [Bacillus cereus]
MRFQLQQIENLSQVDITYLVEESKKEGFNFLVQLVNEYRNEINTFHKEGECLYGVFLEGVLIGIGGLNQDMYMKDVTIGRLRRFYISKKYRRKGAGNILLNKILSHAKEYFHIVVLCTDTEQGSQFYISNGFIKSEEYKGSTHYIKL